MGSRRDASLISPTAHYTGFVWYDRGWSHDALATWQGRALYYGLAPWVQAGSVMLGGVTLRKLLLQRHAVIDHLLDRAIESGRVGQIVEIACGLSPRGWRMMGRHGASGLRYVEADLPAMAERKRGILAGAGIRHEGHHVIALDAMADGALEEHVLPLLDPTRGTAIMTEGLVNYFPRQAVEGMWGRFAGFLEGFPAGVYLSDLHVADETLISWSVRAFQGALSVFTGGGVHFHYDDATGAQAALERLGFERVTLHRPQELAGQVEMPRTRRPDVVRVVEAWRR